jgi:rRNA maturation protein Rpf1
MSDDWRELAITSSEKDSEKLRALIDELIRTLGQEQKHVREEIVSSRFAVLV